MLKPGDKLPNFTLLDQNNNDVHSLDLIGKNLVIFFYPKDNTFICTKEVCSFRDEFEEFKNLNAEVLGISIDTPQSHKAFVQKHNLQFRLLSDEKQEVEKLFGLHRSFFSLLAQRVTFIFNEEGVLIENIDSRWNGGVHIKDALHSLKKN